MSMCFVFNIRGGLDRKEGVFLMFSGPVDAPLQTESYESRLLQGKPSRRRRQVVAIVSGTTSEDKNSERLTICCRRKS